MGRAKPATPTIWLLLILLLTGSGFPLALAASAQTLPDFAPLPSLDAYVDKPTAVAADSQGRVYVAESINNRLRVFSQSGALLSTLSGLAKPISVAVDESGRIFVGNSDLGNVAVYDSGLQPLFKLGAGDGEFSEPADIDIDADGLIYVVDRTNDAVRIYNSTGELLRNIATPGNGDGQLHHPTSLAIDPVASELVILDLQQIWDNYVKAWIDGARLQFFSLDGTFLRGYAKFGYNMSAGELVKPQQVTVDGESRVYVTDSRLQKVMVYSNTNTFLGMIDNSTAALRTPLGLCLSPSGRLYVASLLSGRVNVFGIDSYSAMAVQPSTLIFNAAVGGDPPAAQNATISNNGNTDLAWSATTTSSWLALPTPGGIVAPSASNIAPVEIQHTALAAGTHQGSIKITAPGMEEVVTVTLLLAKGSAAVTLSSLDQTYDGTPKSATATTDPAGLAVNFTYNGSSAPPSSAGTYAVIATVNDSNYQGSAAGTLTINKAGASVTLADLDQTYDGTAKTATATTVPAGLPVTLTYDGGAPPPTAAGSYAVVATVNDSNYQGTAAATLNVGKAGTTVTLSNLDQTYDGTPRTAAASTEPTGLSVNLTYDGLPTAPTSAGTYAVVATVNDPNYQGSAAGTLTVNKAGATVTLGSLDQTYDGTPKQATITTAPEGLAVATTYDGTATPPTAAGSYAVVATVNDPNYQGTAAGTLTVDQAGATVTLGSLNQDYDGLPKSATATTDPEGLAVNFTYDDFPAPPTLVGSYAVVATVSDANHAGSAFGTMTIAPVLPAVTTASASAVTTSSALSGGEVTFNGGTAVTARGVCWNGAGSPTIADFCTNNGADTGPFASALNGLTAGTVYHARAYAANSVGIAYGEEISFTTIATWTLHIEKEGKGNGTVTSSFPGIDCGTDCEEPLEEGLEVILTVTASPGSRFTGWSGDADCTDGVVTMSGDLTCTANFYRFPWPLFRPAMGGGMQPETTLGK